MERLICIILCIVNVYSIKIPEKTVTKVAKMALEPSATCTFTVHKGGPNGPVISGTNLYSELYYKIVCDKEDGYCLRVSNCTVSGEGANQKPYQVIDENGCTTEPSLFEHVQYENDFTAGIYNPLPVRFRGASGAVNFFCTTSMVAASHSGKCERKLCTWNEYSAKNNKN